MPRKKLTHAQKQNIKIKKLTSDAEFASARFSEEIKELKAKLDYETSEHLDTIQAYERQEQEIENAHALLDIFSPIKRKSNNQDCNVVTRIAGCLATKPAVNMN